MNHIRFVGCYDILVFRALEDLSSCLRRTGLLPCSARPVLSNNLAGVKSVISSQINSIVFGIGDVVSYLALWRNLPCKQSDRIILRIWRLQRIYAHWIASVPRYKDLPKSLRTKLLRRVMYDMRSTHEYNTIHVPTRFHTKLH
jgi:hypothetical protein